MRLDSANVRAILIALLATIAIGACGGTESTPTATRPTPRPTPDIEATVVAEVQARLRPSGRLTPTAVPISSSDSGAITAFAGAHGRIVGGWDDLHREFDAWRRGLKACEANSMRVSLRQFAATMGGIAAAARALPRSAIIRESADKLISGVESETEAFRQLRDGWEPEDTTLLENVDTTTAAAQSHLREAQDAVNDLMERSRLSSRLKAEAFAEAFDQLSADWDKFRRNYDELQSREAELTSAEVVARLGELVVELRLIVIAVRELPADETTRGVAQTLAEAAEAEELALRKIRGTFEKEEGLTDQALGGGPQVVPPDPSGGALQPVAISQPITTSAGASNATSTTEEVTFVAGDPTLFDAFDVQMAVSNALRRQAVQALADILEDTSEETEEVAGPFARQLEGLVGEWEQFHRDYGEWRRSEGGCDRSAVKDRLSEFVSDFAALTRATRALAGGTLLGSLRELLVEAAELEERALRDLSNSWQPFDVEIYEALEGKRDSAAKLRRHAATGLDAILAQYDIPRPVRRTDTTTGK